MGTRSWESPQQNKPVYIPCQGRADESPTAQRSLVRPHGNRHSERFDRHDPCRSRSAFQHFKRPDRAGQHGLCADGLALPTFFRCVGRPLRRPLARRDRPAVDSRLLLRRDLLAELLHPDRADDGRLTGQRRVPSPGRDERRRGRRSQSYDWDLCLLPVGADGAGDRSDGGRRAVGRDWNARAAHNGGCDTPVRGMDGLWPEQAAGASPG